MWVSSVYLVFLPVLGLAGAPDPAALRALHARLDAVYAPFHPPYDDGEREAMSDETLEKLFQDAGRGKMLVEFEKDFRLSLERSGGCREGESPAAAREWLLLAHVEVDLRDAGAGPGSTGERWLERARIALVAALKCDAGNGAARRLSRELGGGVK